MPSHHHHIIFLLASKVQRTNKGLSNIHTFLCKLDFLPPDHIGGRCRLFRSLRNQYSSVFYHHIGGGGCRLFRSVRLIGAPNKNDLCSSSVMQIIFLTKAFQIFTLSTKLSFLHNGHFGANVSAKILAQLSELSKLSHSMKFFFTMFISMKLLWLTEFLLPPHCYSHRIYMVVD